MFSAMTELLTTARVTVQKNLTFERTETSALYSNKLS